VEVAVADFEAYSVICLKELGEIIEKPVREIDLWVEIQIGDPEI
jgi:hypothetical protein